MRRLFVAATIGFLSLVLLTSGCNRSDDSTMPPIPITAAGMPSLFPASALRLAGPADLVLAEGRHGIVVTLAEYNASAEDYHFPADLDTVDARSRLLDKVVEHKVIAAEGRVRGYPTPDARTTREEERALVQQVVQQNMILASAISDDEARRFVADHPVRFADTEEAAIADGSALMHVKFVMRDVQFRAEIAEWSARDEVVVHRDRFEELQRDERHHGQ
jgi:hypothetical protein